MRRIQALQRKRWFRKGIILYTEESTSSQISNAIEFWCWILMWFADKCRRARFLIGSYTVKSMTLGFGGDNFYVLLIVCEEARALYVHAYIKHRFRACQIGYLIIIFNTIFKKIENGAKRWWSFIPQKRHDVITALLERAGMSTTTATTAFSHTSIRR